MTSYFTSEFFAGNRRALQRSLDAAVPIVATANGLLQRGADSGFAFSQDANFWYLTGIDEPDITLVIDGTDEFLIVPGREATRETFDGAIDTARLSERSGVRTVVDEAAGWKHLDALLRKHGKVATPAAAPGYIQQYGMYANPARSRILERIHKHIDGVELIDIRGTLANLRMVKQAPELAALQAAIDITSDTLNEVLARPKLDGYRNEYEIEADISRGFRFRGARGHSFEPIVASGPAACTLHNLANDAALNSGDLVVCDVGAEVEHYAADITRTVALGESDPRHQAIYTAVQEAQEYALSLLKPGALLKTYEEKVATFVGKKLKELKLIEKNDSESVRRFFPHATSHFLGLNVHDAGDYTRPLEPGMVITCEPGIYVASESIGVRLEDDVLITKDGHEVLSAACRKELG